uniref:Uncharacterized protein n=1 Tax=viral metagenome TaxID=1070528 RepID=A0A6C0BL61_9ZZZZ
MTDKTIPTSEVIDIAYIPYLVSDDVIELDELFNYLITSGPTDNALIAFRALVIVSEGSILRAPQVLKLHPDFILVAQMTEYSSVMYEVSGDISLERCVHCSNVLKTPMSIFRTMELLHLCGVSIPHREQSNLLKAYELNSVTCTSEAIRAISIDRLNLIKTHDSDYIPSVLERIKQLIDNHERYWTVYARKEYSEFINKFLTAPLTAMASDPVQYSVMKELSNHLTLPEKTSELLKSEVRYNVLVKYRGLERYALGCHETDESTHPLKDIIEGIEHSSIDEYCKLHSDKIRKHYESMGHEIMNDKNVSMESIWDYSELDIVEHVKEGKMWLFTRDEFESLMKNKINHYTKVELDRRSLTTMDSLRRFFAKRGLKSCHTIREMLEGKIEVAGNDISPESVQNPISDILQILLRQ